MLIFPAIDLYEKKAVRLFKGDYNRMTVYSSNPLEIARDFEAQGASCIHLVDLEGAKDGLTPNLAVIDSIVSGTGLFTEVGGGIRSMETIHRYLDLGVDRVILGTAAVTDQTLLVKALEKYGEKIAVGVDIRDGYVAIEGWTQQSQYDFLSFSQHMETLGVKTLICTDISRDGAMKGTNHSLYQQLGQQLHLNITASGGVSTLDDVRRLREQGLYGAIIGKAYYTGSISLKEAIEVAK